MTKTLYTIAVLCICHTTSSCVSRKKIAQNGGDQIHNVTTRFEEKFKADFPGSAMIERIDSSGQNSIYAIINVLESDCRCPPFHKRSFTNLSTIWNDRDPYLDQLASSIAEYLMYNTDPATIDRIFIRLERDKFGKCYSSMFFVIHEQQYWNGGGSFINLERGQYIDHNFLELKMTAIEM